MSRPILFRTEDPRWLTCGSVLLGMANRLVKRGFMRKVLLKAVVLGTLSTCVFAGGEARAASAVCVKKATGIMRYLDTAPVVKKDKKTKKSTTVTPTCDAATEVQLVWNKDGVAG
ncbi:MAG: hypothetical protein NTX25_23685, partial [Proteobacteria bacterium]|nr:hypothetical protein [Pseudomonadota bacterium]